MAKININDIQSFINKQNFDIRVSNNGRFTDQKCIPDVLCAVAESVLAYIDGDTTKGFTKDDIWHSDYSNALITESFSKPDIETNSTTSEYDKFFAQPLKLFASANILSETKQGRANYYIIKELEILEFIALREKNALDFLFLYLNKVMTDSGCIHLFDEFFTLQDKNSFNRLCEGLDYMYRTYTKIKKDYEPPRIYNKIINIFAFKKKKLGSVKGRISKYPITIDELRYNRVNWRDIGKGKNMSRQEFARQSENAISNNKGYYERAVTKAKEFVHSIEKYSEVHPYPAYVATEAHHIFMKSEFPSIADCAENIIALTGTEHYSYAHPNRNTQRTDPNYQMICLLSKLDSIERNFQNGRNDYSLADFAMVLNIGLKTEQFNEQMGFSGIKANLLQYLRPTSSLL